MIIILGNLVIIPPRGLLTPKLRFPYFLASLVWAGSLLGGQPHLPRAGVAGVKALGRAGGELTWPPWKYKLTEEQTLNPEVAPQTLSGHNLPPDTLHAFKYFFPCLRLSPLL